MKQQLLALVGAVGIATSAGGCGFAVKHPAATAAIVGGTMALATCELASSDHQACLLTSGGAAALLGLVAAGALWLGSTGEDSILQPPPHPAPPPRRPAQARPGPGVGGPAGSGSDPAAPAPAPIPAYLRQPPQLFVRGADGAIAPAPAGDHAVAATYAASPARGPIHEGARITILTEKTTYRPGEEVRVVHVLEAPGPGLELHVMGPKPIYSEYVDGVERTPPPPAPQPYDGRVLPSPGVDWGYEVTTYTFTAPGPHRIQWRADGRESNVIEIVVAP